MSIDNDRIQISSSIGVIFYSYTNYNGNFMIDPQAFYLVGIKMYFLQSKVNFRVSFVFFFHLVSSDQKKDAISHILGI